MTAPEKDALYKWMSDVMYVLKQHVSTTPGVADAEKSLAEFKQVAQIDTAALNHDDEA